MKKTLILVRHSIPEIVESLPAREWKLSEQGRMRARRLAGQLSCFQPEVIFSSREPKAIETAELIAEVYKLDLQVADGLHEHDRRNVPYQTQAEFWASIREFFQKPDRLVFGNETADQAHARFERAVHSLLQDHQNKTVVIAAHGTVISLFVSHLTGVPVLTFWEELGLPAFVVLDLQSNILIAQENIA